MIDPNGIITQMSYDAANRTTSIVEDAASGGLQRTTNWTFNPDNLVTQLQAINANIGSGVQNTNYSYGTSSTSGVYRMDLLASVTDPDAGVVAHTYNRLGQVSSIEDQRGTVRSLTYDTLGRVIGDAVTAPGKGTGNSSVTQITTAYEIRGMPNLITSSNYSTGVVVNQIQLVYNDFGQLANEFQAHGGAVVGGTPEVDYTYQPSNGTANRIWPLNMNYPNGRIITFDTARQPERGIDQRHAGRARELDAGPDGQLGPVSELQHRHADAGPGKGQQRSELDHQDQRQRRKRVGDTFLRPGGN